MDEVIKAISEGQIDNPENAGIIRDEKGKFVKGFSGNPAGKPAGSISVTSAIKKKLQESPEGNSKSYLELLVDRILKQALVEGNEQIIKQIWNYIDGMPKQKFGIGLDEDNGVTKLTVEVIKNKDEVNGGNQVTNNNSV